MNFIFPVFAALVVFIASIDARKHQNNKLVEDMSVIFKPAFNDDFGVFTNCGKSNITGKWTPKVISTQGQVTVSINFTAPYDMDGGYGEIDIYSHADGSIVFQYGSPFTCKEVQKYITCPLTKNQYISIERTVTDLSMLSSYPGVYDIVVQVDNNQDLHMLCLNATVTVTN